MNRIVGDRMIIENYGFWSSYPELTVEFVIEFFQVSSIALIYFLGILVKFELNYRLIPQYV